MNKLNHKPKTLLESIGGNTDDLDSLILSLKEGEGLRLSNAGLIVKYELSRKKHIHKPYGGKYVNK